MGSWCVVMSSVSGIGCAVLGMHASAGAACSVLNSTARLSYGYHHQLVLLGNLQEMKAL